MPRRWLSLLALLLLVLSAHAVADEGREESGQGGKDKHDRGHGKDKGHGDDDRDDDGKDRRDGDDDDQRDRKRGRDDDRDEKGRDDDPDEKGRDGDGDRPGKGKAPRDVQASIPWEADLQILPTALPGSVRFTFLPSPLGTILTVDLPDTGAAWTLSGPGMGACRLDRLLLSCDYGDLGAGDARLVQASSDLGPAGPWELVAEGRVSAQAGTADEGERVAARIGVFLT